MKSTRPRWSHDRGNRAWGCLTFLLTAVGLVAWGVQAFAAPAGTGAGALLTLTPAVSDDSWVSKGAAATNYGTDATLKVGLVGIAGDEHQALIRFELSALPSGAVVTGARLELFQNEAEGVDAGYGVWPDALGTGWAETGVTWRNRPPATNLGDPAVFLVRQPNGWREWDVTHTVQHWAANRDQNFGILLRGDGTTVGMRSFYSHDYGEGVPRLTVDYTLPMPSATPTASASATRTRTATATPTASASATRTKTAMATPTPTASATRTATMLYQPTLIPLVEPTPFVFTKAPVDPHALYPLVFTDTRVTQGLEWDLFDGLGVPYALVAGKDTLARFQLHTENGQRTVTAAACHIYRSGNPKPVGVVPAEWAAGWMPRVVGSVYQFPDPSRTLNCWIPGDMLWPAAAYRVVAYVNDSSGAGWLHDMGKRSFRPTVEYFGWFLYPAFQLASAYPPEGTQPLESLDADTTARLTGVTLATMQRIWPLRSGVEAVRPDGSNPHTAGLRYFLSPESYACGAAETDHPYDNPETHLPDLGYTCDANQRAAANAALAHFNLIASVLNLFGTHADYMQLGTLVVPFTFSGGGQSCWVGHKVAGQSVSVNYYDGVIMAHEPAHCFGLVGQSPHANPDSPGHSVTGDIPFQFGDPMINLRTQSDVFAFQSLMNPYIYRANDEALMEGYEWNRLRKIILGDPNPDGLPAIASAEGERRFFLSGRVDRSDTWTTTFSMIVDAPVPLPTSGQGEYAAVILDANGAELARWPFDVSFTAPADGVAPPFVSFNFTLPYPDGSARVAVVHGGRTLADLAPPQGQPDVTVESLEVTDDTVRVRWIGTHPLGAPLAYALYFSPDDGASRTPLAPDLSVNAYTWRTDLAQATDHARLIVVASDGFHTAEAHSERFAIRHRPPVALISAPAGVRPQALRAGIAGSSNVIPPDHSGLTSVIANQELLLRGSGFDLNDGQLAGTALRWASDLEGPLASGESPTVRLRAGTHVLTLQAVSSAGLIGSDSTTVEVLADGDGDGLPDVYEDGHACLSSVDAEDAGQDWDRDGLNALAEYRIGTDPCVSDSDGDGVNDGAEFLGGANPLDRAVVPLPAIAAQPPPLRFEGCGALPVPAPQTIALAAEGIAYRTVTDAAWLQAVRQPDGTLQVSVSCPDVADLPAAGEILVGASGHRPLLISVTLAAGGTGECVGDCDGQNSVTIDEILTMVNIALGNTPVTACDAGDTNQDGKITVDEILTAVDNALNGCVQSP
jgi:hypothetical protein